MTAEGWDLEDCRREHVRLQRAYDAECREHQRTAEILTTTSYALDLARKRLEELQRELTASQRRESVLIAELREAKRQGAAGHGQPSGVTPILPPPRRGK